MKKVRKIFCTLNNSIFQDNLFVPKGTIVQLVQMVELKDLSALHHSSVKVKVSDYINCTMSLENYDKQLEPSRICCHATSGEPVFITVPASNLEYHSTKILNVE